MENNLNEKLNSATNDLVLLTKDFKSKLEEKEKKIDILLEQISRKENELNSLIEKTQNILSSAKKIALSLDDKQEEIAKLIEYEDSASEEIEKFNKNYNKTIDTLQNFEQNLKNEILNYHDKKNQEDLSYRNMAFRYAEFEKRMKQVEQSELFKKVLGEK